jgi:hypothetical protein
MNTHTELTARDILDLRYDRQSASVRFSVAWNHAVGYLHEARWWRGSAARAADEGDPAMAASYRRKATGAYQLGIGTIAACRMWKGYVGAGTD